MMHVNLRWCFWLYFVCIASTGIHDTAFNLTFPDDLQVWCPHTKFCDLEPAQRLDPVLKNKIPCCGSCSCSDDCGTYRNCCASYMDRYKMDDTLRTVCKSLIVNSNHNDVEEQQLFYIVDKCLNFSLSCVDQNASILGSFNPVYSWETNLIYYNRKCADCHNQREVTQFEPAIQCSALKESYTNVVYGVMIGNILDSDCTIKFVPPGDIDMRSQICDPMKKYDCPPESPFYNLSDQCASFNATYLTNLGAFANIYCYLCNSIEFTEAEVKARLKPLCDPDVSYKFWSQYGFTILIDQEILHSVSSEKENEEHQWCDAAHSATLRAVCFE